MKKHQGLSIKYYIKYNKQRLVSLLLSLTVFVTMIYVMAFILEPSKETMRRAMLRQSEKYQIVSSLSKNIEIEKVGQGLSESQAVFCVMPCIPVKTKIDTIVENLNIVQIYLVGQENIQLFLKHSSSNISGGRLPIANNEIVVDESYAKNQGLSIGDTIEDALAIVGMVKSDCYLIAGVSDQIENANTVVALSSGKDVSFNEALGRIGYNVSDFYVEDNISRAEEMKGYTGAQYRVFYLLKSVSVMVVILCLIALFSLYIRDRQVEMCFYYSIGFSKKDIYFSVLRILIFVFVASLLIGLLLSIVLLLLIHSIVMAPIGLHASQLMPREIMRCVSCLVLIFATLQPSIFFAMQKINTIETMEEEMI
jgi:ABC-type antimicrobial peptide transport system permease subunit